MLASLTSIIYKNKEALRDITYPRTPCSRVPIYNPNGKYIIRLYLNGSWKQITIDDFMINPTKEQGDNNYFHTELEFYFSLTHKAFQKVHFSFKDN